MHFPMANAAESGILAQEGGVAACMKAARSSQDWESFLRRDFRYAPY